MRDVWWGVLWIGLYLGLCLAPLFALLSGPTPGASGFGWDFSLALGFAGTAMMGVMFVITARFKRVSAPFGIDLIYYFHRQIALVGLAVVVAHPLLIFAGEPHLLTMLAPARLDWAMGSGIGALLALLALLAASLWRQQLGIEYDRWRLWHFILAVVALVLALAHMAAVNHYVATPWKLQLWGVIALSCLGLGLYVRLARPFLLLRHPYRVEELRRERGDAWSVVLRPDGHGGLRFQAGQFAWLTIWDSPFAMRDHPFSFSGSAEDPERLCFTIKELGDFTRRIGHLERGETVYVDGPYGAFCLDRRPAPQPVLIAGGIGIAPLMSMLRTLADRGDRRPLRLIYAYSSLERLTFADELAELAQRLDLTVVMVLGQAPPDWTGETGMITEELLDRHLPPRRQELECFICGPVPMIEVTERALHRLGVPVTSIHSELFDLV